MDGSLTIRLERHHPPKVPFQDFFLFLSVNYCLKP
jgi:hypothetical protein